MWSNDSTSGYTPKRSESRDLNRNLHNHVSSSMIHNSQKVETNQYLLMNKWIKCGNVYNGTLFIHKKKWNSDTFVVGQSLSHVWFFETPGTTALQASLSFTIPRSSLKLTSLVSVMASNHPVLCHPLFLLPSIFPSNRVFSIESGFCIRWPKYWSFSFSPSNEYSRLISFRIDLLDLLAVQGTLKSLLQHHSSKAPILQCSAFFIVQLSHPYTTGKTITLTRQTFVGKVMYLLFNMLSRLVITFLPRNRHLLISWLQSPSAVILEPRKTVWHCFHCFPIYSPWSDGTSYHDLRFLNVEL